MCIPSASNGLQMADAIERLLEYVREDAMMWLVAIIVIGISAYLGGRRSRPQWRKREYYKKDGKLVPVDREYIDQVRRSQKGRANRRSELRDDSLANPSDTPPAVAADGPDSHHTRGTDLVQFSAFCPDVVAPGSNFLLEVFAYLPDQRDSALDIGRRHRFAQEASFKSSVSIGRGETITVSLSFEELVVEDAIQEVTWVGEIANVQFIIGVPASVSTQSHFGKARVFVNGIERAKMHIPVNISSIGSSPKSQETCVIECQSIRTVFASYSSTDRVEVLKWKRGAESIGADVFVDVVSLRAGDDWKSGCGKRFPSEICSVFSGQKRRVTRTGSGKNGWQHLRPRGVSSFSPFHWLTREPCRLPNSWGNATTSRT